MPHREIQYDLIIFDLDGTLLGHPQGGEFRKAGVVTDWEILPGRQRVIRALHNMRVLVGIATNQAGVGWGMFKQTELHDEILRAALDMGIAPELVQVCYHHPKARLDEYRQESNYRKPRPGMLLELMAITSTTAGRTLFVGDMDTDREAARQATCAYMEAADFFGRDHLLSWGIRPLDE